MQRSILSSVKLIAFAALALAGTAPHRLAASDPIEANPPSRWWKGNLHTHTLWSDGDDFPEMVAEWYREHGYHFLALSDHNVLSQGMRWMKAEDIAKRGGGDQVLEKYRTRFGSGWVETRGNANENTLSVRLKPLDEFRALVEERGRFLMIQGEEISDLAEGVPIHINASNVQEVIAPLGGATVRETITNNLRNVEEQAQKAGREILAHLNHPNFGWAITAEDLAHAVAERYFEVYNGHPGVNQTGDARRPNIDRLWDIANTIRLAHLNAPPLYGIATDDSHNYHGSPKGARPGRGWTMVRATHLTPEHIVRAIKAGDCYASSGVTLSEIEYDAPGHTLSLEIEADEEATFVTQFIGTLRETAATAQPVTAEADETKRPPGRVSRRYSPDVGAVLATQEGKSPRFELTGKELYVRAVVTSSRDAADPSFPGQKQQAWTQPVGWEWLHAKEPGSVPPQSPKSEK